MRVEKDIQRLLENGFKFETIKNWSEKQIKTLSELFKKSETKEAVQVTPSTGFKTTAQAGDEIAIGDTIIKPKGPVEVISKQKPGNAIKSEGEMTERFESKAQQGLFWAKCKNSTGKTKEKWCEMAREFSKSTSKKQYKDMPEKKHPEKTAKRTVKKKTNENFEKFLEDSIVNMLDKHINPSMTKGKLIKSINERKNSEPFMLRQPKKNTMFSQDEGKEMKTMKRPIGKMYSIGKEMSEDTKEKTRTKPDTDTDKKEKGKDRDRKNPFQPKHKPAPKMKKGEYNENTTTAPTKPGTKEKTREKDPGKKNPFQPKHKPAPKMGQEKTEIPTWLTWNKIGVKLK
jgi:hypothetical protein